MLPKTMFLIERYDYHVVVFLEINDISILTNFNENEDLGFMQYHSIKSMVLERKILIFFFKLDSEI